jgi:hypothetical protein
VPVPAPTTAEPNLNLVHDPAGVLAGGRIHGMILEDGSRSSTLDVPDFARLRAIGVNTIVVYIYNYTQTRWSNRVFPSALTPTDLELSNLANLAHSHGFAVEFSPLIWINQGPVWRGMLSPSDPAAFFSSYNAMIVHYAQLAQSLDVELFAIGSEMNSLRNYASTWRAIAAHVRTVFWGLTTYMSTATTTFDITWWDAVDLISLSPYFSLSTSDLPSVDSLYYVWMHYIMPALYNTSVKFHRQVFFNEAGYASVLGTTLHPAIAAREHRQQSELAQANAYEAMFHFSQRASWVRGMVLFYWQQGTLPLDGGYSMVGKQAECVVAKYWAPKSSVSALAAAGMIPKACVATHF